MLVENQIQLSSPPARTPSPPAAPQRHIFTVDAMRGIAALSVCWFHFTNAQFVEQFGAYRATGKYGWLGVQVFFVISGFIIPYSLFRSGYRVRSFFWFLLKRVTRLDPPYLASVLMVVVGSTVSGLLPGHHPYHIPWTQVGAHFAYINAFVGMPWMQMSYWSLAIEFQYYIFVGLCFPLFAWRARLAPVLILALFATLATLAGRDGALLPHYLPVFAVGILTFRYTSLKAAPLDTFAALLAAVGLSAWTNGVPHALLAAASCAAILFLHVNVRPLNWLGDISYSLYLVHVFIGNLVFGLALRWNHNLSLLKWILPFCAVALSIAAACLLHRLVEAPSRRWASRIRLQSPGLVKTGVLASTS